MTPELVVDLPSVNCRVSTHRFSQVRDDLPAFGTVTLV
jgi:hypothetical protein